MSTPFSVWTSVWRLREGLAIVREPVPIPASFVLPPAGVVEAQGWGLHIRVGRADEPAWTWRCPVPGNARRLSVRPRQVGDKVQTRAGSRKVQDVLVDAKVPRPLRDLVPLVASDDGSLAVVGLTSVPAREVMVIDARPADPTWSRRAPWNPATT
jgi:tRNA(Ile)-lysidine synthetase-like protein